MKQLKKFRIRVSTKRRSSSFANHGWQSYQHKRQKKNRQNQINQQSISHSFHLLNQRLIIQDTKVINVPNASAVRLNLSRTAGNITEAGETKPMSEAMSDNLSNCFSFNFGKVNFIRLDSSFNYINIS